MQTILDFDPYEVLGVTADATEAAIKAARKAKLLETHPDRFERLGPGRRAFAEEQTKKVTRAAALLLSPWERAAYDDARHRVETRESVEERAAVTRSIAELARQRDEEARARWARIEIGRQRMKNEAERIARRQAEQRRLDEEERLARLAREHKTRVHRLEAGAVSAAVLACLCVGLWLTHHAM